MGARGGGGGVGGPAPPPPPPLFEKKSKTKLRNIHFLIKGIFDVVRVLDWWTPPKHANL